MTFRRRYRYAGFRVLSPNHLGEKEVREVIQRSIVELLGAHGLSRIEPRIIEYDAERSVGIIRCKHLYLLLLRASLASIATIGEKPAAFLVLKVSGSLRALRS
jgi:RNase P/RNase MRP subunit POP5